MPLAFQFSFELVSNDLEVTLVGELLAVFVGMDCNAARMLVGFQA